MGDPALAFATAYDSSFRSMTVGYSHNEIPLFRAMHKCLIGLGNKHFEVEEHHGTSHQVKFTGNGSYARMKARCELSDLMIITFSSHAKLARLTYLQAKSERATLASVCQREFSANLEQWFLLAKRPKINGAGKFQPPADLLSGALLPSVGSFAFFYKDTAGDFQTYYAAANYMNIPGSHTQRYGKLQATGPCHVSQSRAHTECLAACGNFAFARSLFRLEIGTPIDHSAPLAAQSVRAWLSSILRARIQAGQSDVARSNLAQELLLVLGSDIEGNSDGSFGAKHLIIIKSDT